MSRAQFFQAAAGQISLLGALQSWRDTLRGGGLKARRDLWHNSLAGGQMALSLGGVNVPNLAGFGASAGAALSWSGASGALLEAGTSARPAQLDEMLARFDHETSDDKNPLAPLDRSALTWLRARPVSTKNAEIEATFLRAARDGKAGGGAWSSGDFALVNARLSLPATWTMRGAWTSAQMQAGRAASSWNFAANGPLAHPWGAANVALDVRSTDAGFGTFAGTNPGGERGGDAQIVQQIQTPLVSGQLSANASSTERPSQGGAGAGTELAHDTARAGADLKLKLLPNLALKAVGQVANAQVERATGASSEAGAAPLTARENTQNATGEVGVEVKFSKALSLEANAGRTQTRSAATGNALQNLEDRASFRVRHQTGGGSWGASLQARDRTSASGGADTSRASWAHIAGVGVEGERRLIGTFRLRAGVNWMIDREALSGDAAGVARMASAQFLFSKAARLDVRYRDGAALPGDLSGDPMGALFSSSSFAAGGREIATRFNIGAAANGGKGLGLALEWARMGATTSPNDSWKLGLTYR